MSFDTYAKKWETPRRKKRAKKIAEAIKIGIKSRHYTSALEFGCGTGLISDHMMHMIDDLTLIDTSDEMVQFAKEKYQKRNTQIKVLRKDLLNERHDVSFDLIYSSMVFHHIQETKKILEILYRQLKPAGEICIIDLDSDDGRFHLNFPDFDGHHGFSMTILAI